MYEETVQSYKMSIQYLKHLELEVLWPSFSDVRIFSLHNELSWEWNPNLNRKFTNVVYTLNTKPGKNFIYYFSNFLSEAKFHGIKLSECCILSTLRTIHILEFFWNSYAQIGYFQPYVIYTYRF